ncbi:hypothetical protein PIB30_018816 [Stylosanthes scabra]|uniref:Uncharacterized protein n=1 Tax=Stylosanthes scabra TaxID=79078 RepID=A0ABU6S7K7_9FABA|nr:hypothetical protein [Stylosanthes scabra]
MELYYSCNQGYTPWNPRPYQPHDLGYNAYQSNGFGDAYYGYEDPSPPYPLSQNGMDKLFEALAQERNEIREVQRKTEIQLDLLIKLATLVIEHFNNSSNTQPSNSENLPSQPLSNPWGHIGTLFQCTNQEGREDVLNEEDVESLYESLEEVEEGNEAQVAEDVDQKVEDNCKEPKGMEIFHPASSEVTPSKLPSELQFEWVDLPNLNFIGPQHYALLEKDDQLGALDGVLNKKKKESLELNASKFITCGKSEFKAHSEHLHKLHNNRAKLLELPRRRAPPMARPRGRLGHIRSKLPSCMACSRPPLGASARPCVRTLAIGTLGMASGRAARPRLSDGASARCALHL